MIEIFEFEFKSKFLKRFKHNLHFLKYSNKPFTAFPNKNKSFKLVVLYVSIIERPLFLSVYIAEQISHWCSILKL